MNDLIVTLAAVALAGTAPAADRGAVPVIVGDTINSTTTVLITPSTGQAVLAIEVTDGLLLIPGRSPALAVPLTDPNADHALDVRLLSGLR